MDTRMLIKDYLESITRPVSWLATKVNISKGHMVRILNQDRDLTERLLAQINEALETDFKMQVIPENRKL